MIFQTENIVLTAKTGRNIKIMDLFSGKKADKDLDSELINNSDIIQVQDLVGTLEFMAPEA